MTTIREPIPPEPPSEKEPPADVQDPQPRPLDPIPVDDARLEPDSDPDGEPDPEKQQAG